MQFDHNVSLADILNSERSCRRSSLMSLFSKEMVVAALGGVALASHFIPFHMEMRSKTERVITLMKLDDYGDRTGRLTAAIASVEAKVGRSVRK